MDGWSSTFLPNSGKQLILMSNGQIIDELEYDITWYNDIEKDDGGWSIERINPNDPCSDASNWAASQSVFGGTPGEQNSIFDDSDDTNPPEVILSYEFGGTLALEFNEPLSEESFDAINFTVNGEEPFSVWNNGSTIALLTVIPSPQIGDVFTVEIDGITDCWGNVLNGASVSIGVPDFPEAGDIFITIQIK